MANPAKADDSKVANIEEYRARRDRSVPSRWQDDEDTLDVVLDAVRDAVRKGTDETADGMRETLRQLLREERGRSASDESFDDIMDSDPCFRELLLEALSELEQEFPDARLFVEQPDDHGKVFLVAQVDMTPGEARRRLDEFYDRWWLRSMSRSNRLSIALAFG
jgi:hypothetical protein